MKSTKPVEEKKEPRYVDVGTATLRSVSGVGEAEKPMLLTQAVAAMMEGKRVYCHEIPEVRFFSMSDRGLIWRHMRDLNPKRRHGLPVYTAHDALSACWHLYKEDGS